MKYCFIRDHQTQFPVQTMCRVFKINRSGYYAWLDKPLSDRAIEDQRLLKRIKVIVNIRRVFMGLKVMPQNLIKECQRFNMDQDLLTNYLN